MGKKKQPDVVMLDSYEPDYGSPCENCGVTPTVMAMKDGKVFHHTGMCGPCTWGEAETIDPDTW